MTETNLATAPASEKNEAALIAPEGEKVPAGVTVEPEKVLQGEILSNEKAGKVRRFLVYQKMGKTQPEYFYLLMDLELLTLQWVKEEDMQRWLYNGTMTWYKHADEKSKMDDYWFRRESL